MALSKEFDAKNGFLGGINIKPMNTTSKPVETKTEEPKKVIKKAETKEVKKEAPSKKSEPKVTEKATQKKQESAVVTKTDNEVSVNKGGRPKKYEVEKVRTTLFFPEDLLEDMDIATKKYGSRTDYIVALVKKDLEENKAEYEAAKKFFKN